MSYNYINETGTIQPDTGDILGEVQEEFLNVFGQDLDISPETPQGLLIAVETEARKSVIRNNASLANQINPNLAGGVFLDAICELTALTRSAESQSIITATLSGVEGTIVLSGSRAKTTNGDLFSLKENVVIGAGGTTTGIFIADEFGPIAVDANSLTDIVDGTLGWESLNNSAAGVLGVDEQSDYSLRNLRNKTLALQGVSLPEAIISGLYLIDGVKSLSFRENITSATVTEDSIDIVAHSIYACIDGGADLDIAETLLRKKSMGANFNGDEEVEYTDPFSNQTYTVKFDRPVEKPILVNVSVRAENPLVDVTQAVRDSMVRYANGLQANERGFVVNGNVSTWELAGAVNREYPSIFIASLETSIDDGSTFNALEKEIKLNEVARLSADDISVTEL